ncbi:MAG: peptidase S1 [Proteobacteria bacterium]|nr:peptidase S1 [Pseudomonadota bacterium]
MKLASFAAAAALALCLAAAPASAQDRPDPSLQPSYGATDLVSGFEPDPFTTSLDAGGDYDASQLGVSGCVGFIARPPDYRINWTAGRTKLPLVFSVESDADTTLVVNDAQGHWLCDDDSGNGALNPSITIANPVSGQYDVWVGTFQSGPIQKATLNVSELYSQ